MGSKEAAKDVKGAWGCTGREGRPALQTAPGLDMAMTIRVDCEVEGTWGER